MQPYNIENLEVIEYAAEGKVIAKHDNQVIFIEGDVVPKDRVNVKIFRKKKNYLDARLEKIVAFSPLRQIPFCQHFGVCGGCKWQNLNYESQLKFKEQQVIDAFERIAKVKVLEILPIQGSPKQQFYRNKLEYTFSAHRWMSEKELQEAEIQDKRTLGFHAPKRFDKVVSIEKCHLQDDFHNEIRNKIRDFVIEKGWDFYDSKKQEGFLRTLTFRNTTQNKWMVFIQFAKDNSHEIKELLNFIATSFPSLTSIYYFINTKGNDTYFDLVPVLFKGEKYIEQSLEDLVFQMNPKSFFQTNAEQALRLYQKVREFAQLQPQDRVYDLYTGTGTLALFLARKVKKVIGVEYIEEAVEDAKINAKKNNIQNADFFAGDMKKVLTPNFSEIHGKPDVLITDPPRAGMDKEVIAQILQLAPLRIVYVSCNPATQARDVALLSEQYEVQKIQAFDMFPHTHHIENIAVLTLK